MVRDDGAGYYASGPIQTYLQSFIKKLMRGRDGVRVG